MTTVLVDYESGNLHSAEKAFQRMAAEVGAGPVVVTSDPDQVARADRVVLPGDGAFPACRRGLQSFAGLEEAVIGAVEKRAVPFLGICVGMQMLADRTGQSVRHPVPSREKPGRGSAADRQFPALGALSRAPAGAGLSGSMPCGSGGLPGPGNPRPLTAPAPARDNGRANGRTAACTRSTMTD
jgi:hypothetical protein